MTDTQSVGRYRIIRRLGEGGMGVVYEAFDDRLDRTVALKLMREAVTGPVGVERFWREARAAAALNHPHICQIYELGDEAGQPFIVMERLTGETLAERLLRGSLPARDTAQIALGLLSALQSLHERGLVHRDLKPSNVFLATHGVKLLDFGVAHGVEAVPAATATRLTAPGLIVGTTHYMAPEQISGEPIDGRVDLFAVGAILFECLTGQFAFGGSQPMAVMQKVLNEQPPALVGSALITSLDRVIHRALAKRPSARYQTAEAMLADLRQAVLLDDSGEAPRVTTITRLVVLPFRMLRPDPDVDFLAFSLPDAITASLSAYDALSVRSPLAAAGMSLDALDLRAIAEQLDVDHVLTGTILRFGDQLRISVQLVDAPRGRVLWSHSAQAALGDLFELHDTLCRGICETLPLGHETARRVDVPRTPRAYELYLRANQLALESSTYRVAQAMYERCLEDDPDFAPAWARLGRTHRVIGKYLDGDTSAAYEAAERSFRRALALNPELPLAHSLYTYLETELGRGKDAMVRVIDRLRQHPADAELFAALVHSCRYCGLLDASVAAHERARRLDPQVRTSIPHTWFAMGEYQRCLDESIWLTDPLTAVALIALGRLDDARSTIKMECERFGTNMILRTFVSHLLAFAGGSREDALRDIERFVGRGFRDGEGLYYAARSLTRLGEIEAALATLRTVIDDGFYCYPAFVRDPWLDPLRTLPAFNELLRTAETHHRAAARAFVDHGGDRLLGVHPPA